MKKEALKKYLAITKPQDQVNVSITAGVAGAISYIFNIPYPILMKYNNTYSSSTYLYEDNDIKKIADTLSENSANFDLSLLKEGLIDIEALLLILDSFKSPYKLLSISSCLGNAHIWTTYHYLLKIDIFKTDSDISF